jgi:hypothetical protein
MREPVFSCTVNPMAKATVRRRRSSFTRIGDSWQEWLCHVLGGPHIAGDLILQLTSKDFSLVFQRGFFHRSRRTAHDSIFTETARACLFGSRL